MRGAWVWGAGICALLVMDLVLPTAAASSSALPRTDTVPAGFFISLPWAGKSHAIVCGYGCGHHKRTTSRTSTNDYYGLDFDLTEGEPVRAVADGGVLWANWYRQPDFPKSSWSCYGNSVSIGHLGVGTGVTSFYAHLRSITVETGQRVRRGQVIGYTGNTGGGTHPVCPAPYGPHLHFAMYLNATETIYGDTPPYGGHALKPEPIVNCKKAGQAAGSCTALAAGDTLSPSARAVPPEPSGFTAKQTGGHCKTQNDCRWTWNLKWRDTPNETGYRLYYSGEMGPASRLIATIARNKTSVTVVVRQPWCDPFDHFELLAYNASGISPRAYVDNGAIDDIVCGDFKPF